MQAYEIKENDTFLRITLSKIEEPTNNIELGYGPFKRKDYETDKRSDAMEYLGSAFINIEKLINYQVKETVRKTSLNFGLWTAAIGLLFTGWSIFMSFKDDDSTRINNLEQQINTFNGNQILLLKVQEDYKNKIDSLNNTIDSLEKKLQK